MMREKNITFMDFLKYAALPGIRPRLTELITTGFQHVSYFMAMVFLSVRLLPENHPYTFPSNMGKFGMRHVIASAANNLQFNRKNIDQILLFFCILLGLVLFLIQFVMLGISIFMQPALAAAPLSFADFFVTKTPEYDIAHMMMDMVFGVKDVFKSCVSTVTKCVDAQGHPLPDAPTALAGANTAISPLSANAHTHFPFPIHQGLHSVFFVYSLAILVIATIITSYFIVTILVETAQTGTPFGKRFNKVWAPLRLVAAFGLLVPISHGLNSGQYIVLYAAKFGSGFATNGWLHFNDVITESYLGSTVNLVSQPNVPEVTTLLQFYFLARTCAEIEQEYRRIEIQPYLVRSPLESTANLLVQDETPYEELIDFANGSSVVTMRFGVEDKEKFGTYKGFVKPICGEIKIKLADPRFDDTGANSPDIGTQYLQQYYWFILQELWYSKAGTELLGHENYPENFVFRYGPLSPNPTAVAENHSFKSELAEFYNSDLDYVLLGTPHKFGLPPPTPNKALEAQARSGAWNVPGALKDKGWAGAGIWYNRIAEMNGALTTAVFNIPSPTRFPELMEYVREKKFQYNNDVEFVTMYDPILRGDLDLANEAAAEAKIYSKAYKFWVADGGANTSHTRETGNVIIDMINLLFGTEGLYSMRDNTDTHPLAQLVGIGRSLIESSIQNFGFAVIGGVGGNLAARIDELSGGAAVLKIVSGFLVTFAMIGMTVGFVLFYVVPFLPFLYFFFAVSGWVKGIFEAMVGVPLWALSHIKIDGEGFAGQSALNGYFLVFEIFLRPILIVFGLLAGINIFAALISVLNEIFDLVTSNIAGADPTCKGGGCTPDQIEFYRSPVDEFFYTVLYAVITYLMGISSFKLIDLIPNNILRWMGQSVSTFNDSAEDPVEGMVSRTSLGAQQASSAMGKGLKQLLG